MQLIVRIDLLSQWRHMTPWIDAFGGLPTRGDPCHTCFKAVMLWKWQEKGDMSGENLLLRRGETTPLLSINVSLSDTAMIRHERKIPLNVTCKNKLIMLEKLNFPVAPCLPPLPMFTNMSGCVFCLHFWVMKLSPLSLFLCFALYNFWLRPLLWC